MQATQVLGGGKVLAGRSLEPLPDAVVVIEGDRISTVGAASRRPRGAEWFDARGLTLLPGFIDAHVHIGFADPGEVLRKGVTSARDLGSPPDSIWPLVARSRAAGFPGPELVAVGPILTAPGGYPARAAWAPDNTALEIAGPEEAVRAVRATVASGAAAIKIALDPLAGPVLGDDTLRAVVRAAHAWNRRVTAHVVGLDQLGRALEAGVDELAHLPLGPDAVTPSSARAMAARRTIVVPTLSIFRGRARARAVANARTLVEAGVELVYGTDLGNDGPRPGIDRSEIEGMLAASLDARAVIVSATIAAARLLGLTDRGALEPGLLADIVAVRGDPLADARALTRVVAVWRRGRRAG